MNRRKFLKHSSQTLASGSAAATGLWLLSTSSRHDPAGHRLPTEPTTLRPPGALGEGDFLAACIRCQRCQDACPSQAIRLAGPGDPVERDTPFIQSTEHACTLCLECTRVCPTGALRPVADKAEVRMGEAIVDKRTCVSHNGSGVCGACHTACPFRNTAITQGLRNAPTVHPEHCVGCGLCEEACIVEGTKAIRVFSGRRTA